MQTLIFRTRLNSIHREDQTKAFLLCGRSEGGCGGGGRAWNWLRDRGKQNEFPFFFFAEEEIFKRELQLFSNRRKVERADTEVTNITSGGEGGGDGEATYSKSRREESYCKRDNAFIIFKIEFSGMHNASVMFRIHCNS